MKAGRPTKKTDELISKFLLRLMKGEAVKSICKDKDMPVQDTIYKWLLNDDKFAENYARAKEIGMEQIPKQYPPEHERRKHRKRK